MQDGNLHVSRMPKPFIPRRWKAADADGPGIDRCPKCGNRTFQVDKDEEMIAFG